MTGYPLDQGAGRGQRRIFRVRGKMLNTGDGIRGLEKYFYNETRLFSEYDLPHCPRGLG